MALRTYWVSFRIADNYDYDARYRGLIDDIKSLIDGKYWDETSSFILFSSTSSIDTVVSSLKNSIDEDEDVILVGCTHFKTMRVIGNSQDDDIFSLVDFASKE